MSTDPFTSLANARLATQSRLFANSCCPDKDLVVLFSRLGGNDRMSLWSLNQGIKKWETDIGDADASSIAVCMVWSPDGQSIAVARDPPSVAIYSIQDGRRFHVLPIAQQERGTVQLSGVWWFTENESSLEENSNIPDIFKRNGVITGSAHSILKMLPLLDHLQDENDDSLTATDVFAFQGSHNRTHRSSRLPAVFEKWPTLAANPIASSISTAAYRKSTLEKAELDAMDTLTTRTILLAVDNQGHVFPFLDGIYPAGVISLDKEYDFLELKRHPIEHRFVGQPRFKCGSNTMTLLRPVTLSMPLLATRKARDLAKLSTTARELMWYLTRVVKEMRESWYGSESQTGAREFGPKWVRALEAKQREFCAEDEPDPILDLTSLLTTGRASEALTDFLGSGQDMSDRGIHKWETIMTEVLVKLRDFGERRCAPALQRLFLVIDELVGWAKFPHFAVFELNVEELIAARDLIRRGIIVASWLAVEARKELCRFQEFIFWLRFEVTSVISPNDANSSRHDILEVNHYFMSGLHESPIDRWFTGPVPCFNLVDMNIPETKGMTLSQAIKDAREAVEDPTQTAWQMTARENDIRHLDRNLEVLIQELTERCQRIFLHASSATSRSARVPPEAELSASQIQKEPHVLQAPCAFPFRERITLNEDGEWLQHLIVQLPSELNDARMLLIQVRIPIEGIDLPSEVGVAILECYHSEEEGTIDILNVDFFDDDYVVIVYRDRGGNKQGHIGTLSYSIVGYQKQLYEAKNSSCEDLMHHCVEMWNTGQIVATKALVYRKQELCGSQKGAVSLALNGRVGRRVGCVLDSTGTRLETFDLEGEAEDAEDAEEEIKSRTGET